MTNMGISRSFGVSVSTPILRRPRGGRVCCILTSILRMTLLRLASEKFARKSASSGLSPLGLTPFSLWTTLIFSLDGLSTSERCEEMGAIAVPF